MDTILRIICKANLTMSVSSQLLGALKNNIAPAEKPSQNASLPTINFLVLLLMEEILHHLGCKKNHKEPVINIDELPTESYWLVQHFFHQQCVSLT